ncbi:MAG: hypothetical protein WBB28_02040 [Crinalium sp.]
MTVMTTQKIEIKVRGNEKRNVEAEVYGHLALHKQDTDNSRNKTWVITHVPSGLEVITSGDCQIKPKGVGEKSYLKRLLLSLRDSDIDLDWEYEAMSSETVRGELRKMAVLVRLYVLGELP